jgi:arylsulfatase A-like enzyme
VYANLDAQSPAFRQWALRRSAELVETMAGASGPDLVALLADGFGFGRVGGHGGAQEKVQRIPMIIHVPGEAPSTRSTPLRLMDVAPEVIRVLGLDGGG